MVRRQWLVLLVAIVWIAIAACGSRTGLLAPSSNCTDVTDAGPLVPVCETGTTTLSGTVFDPAGKNPLYDVVVYVPGSQPSPLPSGVTCSSCSDLYTGNPIATALTDAFGNFILAGVPAGNIPLVVQVGKWRRQFEVAGVKACQQNTVPSPALALPSNRDQGDIPSIAVSTGGADTLECLFRRMGVDASEYTGDPNGAGRIHIFQGSGHGHGHAAPNTSPAGPSSPSALWDTAKDLARYDMVLLSCEGQETANMNQQALFDYAAAGGRVFASHFHYAWFDTGPFGAENLATWLTGDNSIGNIDAVVTTTLPNGLAFPKGEALATWLGNVGALLPNGELPVLAARNNANVTAANVVSQTWLAADSDASVPGAPQDFSFNTPLGAQPPAQCGQVVFSDMHIGAASGDSPNVPVPEECAAGDLSPQEMVLEFIVFNLSSCVTPSNQTPQAPTPCR
jgi:hypothetical protein